MTSRKILAAFMILAVAIVQVPPMQAAGVEPGNAPVIIRSAEWQLVGDFTSGIGDRPRPAVLLLNKANGDRRVYERLAAELARRGISSLRLDLRGHGESVNAGRFIPFDEGNNEKIFVNEHEDIQRALEWLVARDDVNSRLLGVVGASYSGEVAMKASRNGGTPVYAYAFLSPGSLSEESITQLDLAGRPWLFVRASRERSPSVARVGEAVLSKSRLATVREVDSDKHATDLLLESNRLDEEIADWFRSILLRPDERG